MNINRNRYYFLLFFLLLQFYYLPLFSQVNPWAKSIGGATSAGATDIALDPLGNIYIVGNISQTVDFQPGPGVYNFTGNGLFVAKYNNSGFLIWVKAINASPSASATANGIVVNANQEVFITGKFIGTLDFDPGAGTHNLSSFFQTGTPYASFIGKLNSNGSLAWAYRFMNDTDCVGTGIALDNSSNVIVSGYFGDTLDFDPGPGVELSGTPSWTVTTDMFILKLSNSGNFIWNRTVGTLNDIIQTTAQHVDASGNILVSGIYNAVNLDFDPGPGTFTMTSTLQDFFVLKLNSSGNFTWAKTIGSSGNLEFCNALTSDPAGNVYMGGFFANSCDFDPGAGVFTMNPIGNKDIFTLKLNATGNFIWARQVGGSSIDELHNIVSDKFGRITFSGVFSGTVDMDPGVNVVSVTSPSDNAFISRSTAQEISCMLNQLERRIMVYRVLQLIKLVMFMRAVIFWGW